MHTSIRFTESAKDKEVFVSWCDDKEISRNLPAETSQEKEWWADYVLSFTDFDASLTLELHGEPIGIATLMLTPYIKLKQHAPISLCIAPEHRRKGYGKELFNALCFLAKRRFLIELLSAETIVNSSFEGFLKALDFKQFVSYEKWFRIHGEYYSKLGFEKEI